VGGVHGSVRGRGRGRSDGGGGGGRDCPHPSRTAHPATDTMCTGSLSPGVTRPGRDVDHPPHLAPRLKKE